LHLFHSHLPSRFWSFPQFFELYHWFQLYSWIFNPFRYSLYTRLYNSHYKNRDTQSKHLLDYCILLQSLIQTLTQIIYMWYQLNTFKSIMLLTYHRKLSGHGVTGRWCKAWWIALIRAILVVLTLNRGSAW
jgi:hypothetical protein